ncbi:hypothetical protein LINGRAHAP2_LOCUS6689 [Linum grandiflorum]
MSRNRESIDSGDEEDLSDIDDNEISGCINDERQVELKSKIWELMHGQYLKRKRDFDNLPPEARKKLKADSRKSQKSGRNGGRLKETEEKQKEQEKKKAKEASLSSKINFEALKKFTDDGEDDDGKDGGGENNDESEKIGENNGGGEEYGYFNQDDEYESDRNSEYDDCELY